MIRVLALTKYGGHAASTRQRLLQYEPMLNANGFEVKVSPLLSDDYVKGIGRGGAAGPVSIVASYLGRLGKLTASGRYDLLWVQYELFPYLPGLTERLVRLSGRPVILDYDDAIFHLYDKHPRAAVRQVLGRKLVPLLKRVDCCLCGNRYIRDYVREFCADSPIVPTVVGTSVYVPRAEPRAGRTTVGWIGSPSTWNVYTAPILPELLPMLRRVGARLRVVGAGPAAEGIDGVDAVEWSELAEVAELQKMDIGIMPLPDEPWARGKCGYKLIQYMACGLPVVASPVGVNTEIVTAGENGYFADSVADWTPAVERLLGDGDLRRRLGANGRARVVERYSLDSTRETVLSAFRRTAAKAPVRQN